MLRIWDEDAKRELILRLILDSQGKPLLAIVDKEGVSRFGVVRINEYGRLERVPMSQDEAYTAGLTIDMNGCIALEPNDGLAK